MQWLRGGSRFKRLSKKALLYHLNDSTQMAGMSLIV